MEIRLPKLHCNNCPGPGPLGPFCLAKTEATISSPNVNVIKVQLGSEGVRGMRNEIEINY